MKLKSEVCFLSLLYSLPARDFLLSSGAVMKKEFLFMYYEKYTLLLRDAHTLFAFPSL